MPMTSRPRRSAKAAAPAQKKRDATRAKLLVRALKLFQKRGVEATTMRDIATAAGLSLGAAYYYFPSKEALVFAYYEANQAELEVIARSTEGTVRERLGALFHAKLASIRPQRKMLSSIIQRLIDPSDPVGAFSTQTRDVRDRAIAVIEQALAGASLPPDVLALAARAMWLAQMGLMLVFVNDDSPGEKRTHGLVDDLLDLLVPILPLLATPVGQAMCANVVAALGRAGIAVSP